MGPMAAEVLETKLLLSQALPFDGQTLIVAGTADQAIKYHFEFASHDGTHHDEVGVFIADDAQGRVAGLLPGTPGYAAAVLKSANHLPLFDGSEKPATSVDVTFHGGDY